MEGVMKYDLSTTWTVVLAVAVLWDLAWKGAALWRAAHRERPGCFVVLLVVNSAGLLPLFYLLSYHQPTPKAAGAV